MTEVAMFGAGRIGKIHAGNLVRQPGVKLRYVVDVDARRRRGARRAAWRAGGDGRGGVRRPGGEGGGDRLVHRHARRPHHARGAAGKAIFCEKPVDLARRAGAHLRRRRRKRAGVTCMIGFQRRFDPTFAALKARLDAGEIGEPEMLVVTSRDPGAPPVDYLKRSGGIFKDMLIHDFDIFRWILDDEAATRLRDRQRADRSRGGRRRRRRFHGGDDSHEEGPAGADQHDPPRGVRLRPALRGARQQGHAAGGQSQADRGRRVARRQRQPATSPSISSSSAIAPRTRSRWRTSSTRSRKGSQGAHVDRRRREGARARRGRDDVVARKADRRAHEAISYESASSVVGRMGRRHAENLAHARARRASSSPPAARSARSSSGRATRSASGRCTTTTRRCCARARTSTRCSWSRRTTLHPAADHRRRCTPASTCSAKSRCRSMLDECLRVEAEAAKHPRSQGDDRLRAPLRRELPGRARAASRRARSAGRSWCARKRCDQNDPSRLLRALRADVAAASSST